MIQRDSNYGSLSRVNFGLVRKPLRGYGEFSLLGYSGMTLYAILAAAAYGSWFVYKKYLKKR
jgi:hypothetical protein